MGGGIRIGRRIIRVGIATGGRGEEEEEKKTRRGGGE